MNRSNYSLQGMNYKNFNSLKKLNTENTNPCLFSIMNANICTIFLMCTFGKCGKNVRREVAVKEKGGKNDGRLRGLWI